MPSLPSPAPPQPLPLFGRKQKVGLRGLAAQAFLLDRPPPHIPSTVSLLITVYKNEQHYTVDLIIQHAQTVHLLTYSL